MTNSPSFASSRLRVNEILEQHFDTAFAAPGGIARLRELILTLAMQGKLVEQDPNDPPASELLKEIEKERASREGAKTRRKEKKLPPIKVEEVPYELPQGWEWVRLGDIGIWKSGSTPSRSNASFYGGNIPWVKSGEVKQGRIKTTEETITQAALDKCSLHINGKGSVLVAMYGANIGEVGILEIEAATNQAVCACNTYTNFDENYLLYLITSLKPYFLRQGAGAAQPNISREKIVATIFPLPPLPEQHRIVARIDQLMARCDKLEKLRKEREAKRLAVHAAAIKQLLDPAFAPSRLRVSQDSSNLRAFVPSCEPFAFLAQHFGELYTVKENVAELRKAILQLAIMGRLVPQDPNDPPASELLKEIEAEKQRLVKAKKIKRPKPVSSIPQNDEPFPVPDNWRWVRIAELAESIDYGTSQKTCDDSSLVPVYRMGNIIDGQLIDEGFKYIAPDIDELSRLFLQPNDILFNRTNSYDLVGKSARYTGPVEHATFASYLIRVRLFDALLNPMFISQAMNAPYFRSTQIEPEIVQQCGQANFNGTKLSLCAVPLPPLPEQGRIVARIDQLIGLCDTLDKQIDAANDKQTELLKAIMTKV
ncbi:restriction endonuclease subunit S [Nitrosomonas sp. ANs5]|uniref:restriction endonuclease subunit S n=1 Tax=Nitrosomonas sp. ANs5 TaxID=3423941 RepID=UPI003D34F5F6